jgi:hypothetical protein
MEKIKLFAHQNPILITIIAVFLTLLINVSAAAYIVGKVSETQEDQAAVNKDQKEINKEQADINKTTSENLLKVTIDLNTVADKMANWEVEHGELMRMHHLYPHQWQTPNTDKGEIQPFPK